jgi:hypothetical protein
VKIKQGDQKKGFVPPMVCSGRPGSPAHMWKVTESPANINLKKKGLKGGERMKESTLLWYLRPIF